MLEKLTAEKILHPDLGNEIGEYKDIFSLNIQIYSASVTPM
jgi:hypothetical protein